MRGSGIVILGIALFTTVFLSAAPAPAQFEQADRVVTPSDRAPSAPARTGRTYGVSSQTVHTIGAYQFNGYAAASSANFIANGFASRGCSGQPCTYYANVMLPEGAVIQSMELDACDTDAIGQVSAQLIRTPDLEAGGTEITSIATGGPTTPGCNFFFSADFAEPVDNLNNRYDVQVLLTGDTLATRFWAVRLYYTLQVSPAPANATFTDVPTDHPFFRFIEALAAAGITGGCSVNPPMYCPDTPLTRGQMAVFLSRALGLHFAP
jgi:hypothetical protein